MDEKDQRWIVRWWDERAQRWGQGGANLTRREAEQQQGILLGLHSKVEIVPDETAQKRRR